MLPLGDEARALVEELGLHPHPEGGWFRRTWTAPDARPDASGSTRRAAASSIQYLLESHTSARWHRIDATEVWTHIRGAPIVLSQWVDHSGHRSDVIDSDLTDDAVKSCVVEADVWQSARTDGEWSLAVCVVVPEFRFEGFELAPEGWEPPMGRL